MREAATDALLRDVETVTLAQVLRFLGRAKWTVMSCAILFCALGIGLGWVLPKKYRAEAVLIVVTPNETRAGALGGQMGALASLVGLDLSGGASKSETLETLRSQYLARLFIERNQLMPLLFAKDWDAAARTWRERDPAEQPTLEDGVRRFRERILRVSEDKQAGTILVSVTWPDAAVAARWVNEIVVMANEELRRRAVVDAQKSIDYLEKELPKTSIVEVRESMFKLMDTHMRTIVIARTRSDFALRSIDPAVAPDSKDYVSPRRVVLALIGALFGLLLGAAIHAARERRA